MYFVVISALLLIGTRFGQSVGHASNTSSDISFSRNFGVYFHPPLVKPKTPFTLHYQEIIPFLEKVRSRFTAISVQSYTKEVFEKGYTEIYTPVAAATLNARNHNGSLLDKKDENQLKVYLSYDVDLQYEFDAVKLGSARSTFDNAKQLADQANQIHNGTVEHIMMNLFHGSLFDVEKILEQLKDAKSKSSKGTWKYKLGIALPIERCLELASELSTDNWRLLSLADFSVFSLLVAESDLKVPVQQFSQCLQRKMEKCKKILSRGQSQLEVGFFTMWPGGGEREKDLVWYWRWLNDWVERTNSTVFMFEAFDNPGRIPQSTLYDALGWWQVDHNIKSAKEKTPGGYPTVTEKWLRVTSDPENILEFKECKIKAPQDGDASLENFKCLNDTGIAFPKSGIPSPDSTFKHDRFIVYFAAQFQRSHLKNVFDEDDFIPLLELVRTKFSNIMVAPVSQSSIEYGSSTLYIPTAVAKLNLAQHKIMTRSHPPNKNEGKGYLKLFFMYDQHSLQINQAAKARNITRTSFDLPKQLADHANSIFNGTIEHLVLRIQNLSNVEEAIAQLEYTSWRMSQAEKTNRSSTNKFSYKLGMMLNVKFCGGSSFTVVDYLEYFFRFVSFVVYESPIEADDLLEEAGNGGGYILGDYQIRLEFCLRKMRKSYPHIEVMFSTSWSTTDAAGKTSGTEMTAVWEAMNLWSKKTNSSVLMYEAFDNLATGIQYTPSTSLGWWQYEENCPCAKSTAEYRFVEKRVFEGCSPSHNKILSGTNSHVHGKNVTDMMTSKELTYEGFNDKTLKFNRPRFVVHLDSFDNLDGIQDNKGEASLVTGIIRMTHTRFSRIILTPIQEGNVLYKERYTTIPQRAAEMNRAIKSRIKGTTEMETIEVLMTFGLESLPLLQRAKERTERTSFDVVLKLANEANAIYPETVKMLMLQYNELNEDVKMVVEQLKTFQKKVDAVAVPYKIGILLSIVDCSGSEEDNDDDTYFWAVLPHVKVVYFTYRTTQQDWEIGADESAKTITDELLVCKEKVHKQFPDLEVGLHTSWSDTDEEEKQNLTGLVTYWGNMNRFSGSANTTVILSKVFDGRDATTEQVHHTGWWMSINHNTAFEGAKKVGVFEEKYQLVRSKKEPSPNRASNALGLNFLTFLIVGSIFLFGGFGN